ncbi:hypothetical protein AK812_SmicGene44456 [Symbiodinium microadriaticum]|uniref:Uncharacterized protein n=1 Tax=Symbiodinium microadriaticum TaxID=2951 RepID=A0A1Q9BYF2_SYMMI|nr:hypothetical protein AK812_SmicGene44456 [Symbiodinium microadriaticum]
MLPKPEPGMALLTHKRQLRFSSGSINLNGVHMRGLRQGPGVAFGHIGCDHLVIPGPGVERQVSDGFQLISSPRRESGALFEPGPDDSQQQSPSFQQAHSGAAGLLVLHAGAS